jgi:hypothetical protein
MGKPTVATAPTKYKRSKFVQMVTAKFDQAYHHLPPAPLSFTPHDTLKKFGCRTLLNIKSDLGDYDILLARLEQQLQYWNNLPENKTTVINSLLTVLIPPDECPYEYFDHRGQGSLIGIYKRGGETIGQAVWFNMDEAQWLVKYFMFNLNMELHFPDKYFEILRLDNLTTSSYEPVNFLNRGYKRDFVYTSKPPAPSASTVRDGIILEMNKFNKKNVCIPMGTLDLYKTKRDNRMLFCIIKKYGPDAGQRIWLSVHEVQHLLHDLVKKIDKGIEEMTCPCCRPNHHSFYDKLLKITFW